MRGVNKVILLGAVGGDPKECQTKNGSRFCVFSLCTNDYTKEKGEIPVWHDVMCYTNLADFVLRYVHKGDKLYVEGRLNCYVKHDKDNGVHKVVSVVPSIIQKLDWRGEPEKSEAYKSESQKARIDESISATSMIDDDIPF